MSSNLKHTFDFFKDLSVLIIGDVMVDAYLWGNVARISPEAPVPVVSCSKRENRPGGAANVGLNVLSLGANPIICSVIGNDDKGDIFMELLRKEQTSEKGIIRDDSRTTTSKTRIISNDQQLLRVDQEITNDITYELENELIKKCTGIMEGEKINAIIFQDYDKGAVTERIIEKIIALAKKKDIPVLVDPKRKNFLKFASATVFKPNFKEFVEGLNLNIGKQDVKDIFTAAKKIHNELGIEYILITLSELGVFISNKDEYRVFPAEIRDVADVSGAGDTVISVAGVCMAAGIDPFTAAIIANVAGGLVCEKVGVVPVNKEQLLEECGKLNIGE